ncbi:MAG: hypothetical protein ACRDQA_02460 [Nocardioidaceae bacterium]
MMTAGGLLLLLVLGVYLTCLCIGRSPNICQSCEGRALKGDCENPRCVDGWDLHQGENNVSD